MPNKEENPPEVEVEEEKEEGKGIEVDLDHKEEPEAEEKPVTNKDLEKMHKRMEYQARQYDKSQKEMKEALDAVSNLYKAPPAEEKPIEKEEQLDKIDEVAEKDWKKAVRMLGREEAERLYKEQIAEDQLRQQQEQNAAILEGSKQKVIERYSKIEDSTTIEGQYFAEEMQKDPSILTNNLGPEIAMARMEERLINEGITPAKAKPIIDDEIQRRQRVLTTGAAHGTVPRKTGNVVQLTKDQKEYCDYNTIPYDQYANSIKSLEKKGEVSA